MRILYIVPYVPSRIRVRSFELIRHLAERGHDVTVATLFSTREEREQLAKLVPFTKEIIARRLRRSRALANCARAVFSTGPLQAAHCWHPGLAKDIRGGFASRRFDVVHVEHLRGAVYGLDLMSRTSGSGAPCAFVWDSVDCISDLQRQTALRSRSVPWRLLARLELPRTLRREAEIAREFGNVVLTARADAEAMRALTAGESPSLRRPPPVIHVVPAGVDTEHFRVRREPEAVPVVTFVGKMSYHANLTAAVHLLCDLMPAVWKARPEVRLYIVGKDPPRRLRRLARERGERVVVTGTVEDVRTYLHRASVAVAPLTYATGMQNKILEYMATGTPVVASPRAISALTAEASRAILVSESDADFARHVLGLIEEPERATRIGLEGRKYVEQNHSWRESARNLENVYASAQQNL